MTPELDVNPATRIPAARREWTRLMSELGIRPNKGLGQHFLFERGIVERMVRQAGVGEGDTVLEVGPGLGILTSELLRKAGTVVAVELDRSLAAHLRDAFGDLPGFRLVEGNALKLPIDEIVPPGEPFDVVANLPYSVGSAIMRHLLEQPRKPRRMTVMLQKGGRRAAGGRAAGHERPERGHAILRHAATSLHGRAVRFHSAAKGGVGGGDPRRA
jgi:16S rRNA (adenine1518-N6/adenine1519-N6)-dimethyltransferase